MRSILVLRGGALGDFIVTLPALAALRRQWPAARIELAGNATAASLAVNRGLLDAAYSQHEARWGTLFAETPLPPEFAGWLAGFDLIVNYWPDPDGDLERRFPLRRDQQFVSWPAMPTCAPAADHYLLALRSMGLEMSDVFCRLAPLTATGAVSRTLTGQAQEPTLADAHIAPREAPSTWIAVHPGSGSPRKNWPAQRWTQLIGNLPSPVLLVIGEPERETWDASRWRGTILERGINDGSVRIACGLSLEALVAELTACRLFLGHDSGVSHLAAACGVPCVLLFGPTEPAVWAPPASHVRIVQNGSDLSAISVHDVEQAMADVIRHS